MIAAAIPACGPSPESKIRGWPPSEEDRALLREMRGETADVQDSADVVDADVVSELSPEVPAEAPTPEVGPCAAIVAMACDLYGGHTDGCQEARSKPPDDNHPQTREACAELLKRFNEVELPRAGGACYRFTRALCGVFGEGSERCRSARATIQLARSRREHRICLGDWLLLETRTFRR